MEHKHTTGPWEIDDEYVYPVGGPDLGICAIMNMDAGGDKGWFRGPITEANARLIASAPDLLEALEAVDNGYCCGHDLSLVINEVRAAIAKATRSQP